MSKLQITYANPHDLQENPWNPNEMDSINEEKLMNSIGEFGLFKPILCRELDDGSLQILGGQHRNRGAVLKGLSEVPVLNLGRMSDEKAKKIGLVDNGRYGEDDIERLAQVFADIGSPDEIVSILPIDMTEFENIFGKEPADIDYDDLITGLSDEDAELEAQVQAELQSSTPTKTHQIMRFKVQVEDAPQIQALISRIQREQGFTESDSLTNVGDALVYLLGTHPEMEKSE